MSDELKPCHRCGKPAEHADRYDGEQTVTDYGACCCANVECPEFGCQYDVEIWNARPIEDALRARIKELEEAMPNEFDLRRIGHDAADKELEAQLDEMADEIKKVIKR